MNQEVYKRPKPAGASGASLPTSGENATASAVSSITIGSKPSVISKEPMRFLVMDAPRQSNLHLYIKECRKQGVTDLVRVCEPTYSGEVDLANAGIQLHELAYPDGTSPPKDVIDRWLELVHQRFFRKHRNSTSDLVPPEPMPTNTGNTKAGGINNTSITPLPERTIAVHCVAGLGRAPVLVAIALVEFAAMDPVDAVTFIRRHRRGAINEKQLNYLEKYKKNWKGSPQTGAGCACAIM